MKNEKVVNEEVKKERMTGEGVGFESIRRITGYLVGTTNRWNNAKLAELNDRVTHNTGIKGA